MIERAQLDERVGETGAARIATYADWIGSRSVGTLGTNQGASALAFQNWRRFKEAFAPELVERALRETGEVTHLVDPFGGSGTTALTAQFLGAHTTTIEVNPFLADLIEAKLAKYDFPRLVKAFAAVMQAGRTARPKLSVVFAQAPATLIEPGLNGRYIFGSRLARRLAGFRCAIDEVKDPAIRRFFRVQLASAAVQISNVVVSGKGRRYRRGWEHKKVVPSQLDDTFSQNVLAALYDLRNSTRAPLVLLLDARGFSKARA